MHFHKDNWKIFESYSIEELIWCCVVRVELKPSTLLPLFRTVVTSCILLQSIKIDHIIAVILTLGQHLVGLLSGNLYFLVEQLHDWSGGEWSGDNVGYGHWTQLDVVGDTLDMTGSHMSLAGQQASEGIHLERED